LDDRTTLDRLVFDHLPSALRLAVRLTGDPDEAEELVQDSLVRVTCGWSGFRGDSSFQTWLFRIVVNTFRDRLRRRPPMGSLENDVDDRVTPGPAEAVFQSGRGGVVALKVSALPSRQREVLVLSVYEQLPPREVAAVVGISEANVYSTLHQARARLRKELSVYMAEGDPSAQ
jgi:RNA polymerase sigma-70 factor (ECF subfamily)